MKKKTMIILAVVLLLVLAAAAYAGVRLARRGTDITGVTTLPDRNTVYVNSGAFEAGSGWLTVGEGEAIILKYDFSAGSIDVFFRADENGAPDLSDGQEQQEPARIPLPPDYDPNPEDQYPRRGKYGNDEEEIEHPGAAPDGLPF